MKFFKTSVLAQKNGFDHFAQLGKRLVPGMLDFISGETAQYGFWVSSALLERRRIFNHLVVLLDDQFPHVRFHCSHLADRHGLMCDFNVYI